MLTRNPKIRKGLFMALCCLIGISVWGSPVQANGNADSYNYSYWGRTVASPAAYTATGSVNGLDIGIGILKEPSDIQVTSDNYVYILDSGNNRVVILDQNYKLFNVIDSFDNEGTIETLLNPQGLYVTQDKKLLIADTGNKRIVELDKDNNLIKVIEAPQSELLNSTFDFQPVRVVADKAQRIYVMSIGVFDGLMEFSAAGEFNTFTGANRVNVDPLEYFWKTISTQEQQSKMIMFTPTEFTNLDINEEDFLYVTNGDQWGENIKMLNAQGSDIMRRNGYFTPQGDIRYYSDEGPSRLVDIDVTDSEIFSVLDAKRGRIFTYNGDGHLLYVFGGLGNKLGEFKTPTAITRMGNDFLVLDKALGEITVFQTTEYGRMLNEAVRSYYRGDEEKAFDYYQQTINMNSNLEFAYGGIGKALLRQGNYKEAMSYFKKSMDQKNYSKAYLLYRKEVLREYFSIIMTGIFILVVGISIATRYRKIVRRKRGIFIE
ncbi:MAG TPA: hypothetical protein IAA29_09130 [Candidatus Paenibacillus intestinavium]|nr:hypothetical protein [Candidatus Paenibacillus intestinavium]